MSEGPIKREREAWEPPRVSTPNKDRVCFRAESSLPVTYCGRRPVRVTADLAAVNCADCTAALRADERIP